MTVPIPEIPGELREADPNEVAAVLARNLVALYAEAELRVANAIARALRASRTPDQGLIEQQAALLDMINTIRRILAQVDDTAPEIIAVTLDQGYAYGARGVLDELADLAGFPPGRLDEIRAALPGAEAVAALVGELTGSVGATHVQILRFAEDAYRRIVATQAPQSLLGTQTSYQAAAAAWRRLLAEGITGFVDRSGRRWALSSYVEMATRATVQQARIQAQLDTYDAAGIELVSVNDVPEECLKCRPWENKVLSRGDEHGPRTVQREHATIDDRMVDVDIAGTVAEARLKGLFHPNCRHRLVIFLPGVTKLKPSKETADPQGDENRRRLRELERKVRRAKLAEASALDDIQRAAAARDVRAGQAAIRDHIAQTGQLRQRYREQVNLGFRKQPGEPGRPSREARAEQEARLAARQPVDEPDVATNDPAQPAPDQPSDQQQPGPPASGPAGENPPAPAPPLDLARLTDDELAERVSDVADDEAALEAVLAELERRDQMAAAAEQAAEQVDDPDAEKWAEVDRRAEAGEDYEVAYADVFEISLEQLRRDEAIRQLRDAGHQGRGFDELARSAFRVQLDRDYLDAEAATNGFLLTPEGQRRGLDPRELWRQNEAYARRWASDELKAWWDANGRITFDEYRAQLLSGRGEQRFRTGGETFLQ